MDLGMHKQHGRAYGHAAGNTHMSMQYGHGHGHAEWTLTWMGSFDMVIPHEHRPDMDMSMQYGPRNAARTWSCSMDLLMQLGPEK